MFRTVECTLSGAKILVVAQAFKGTLSAGEVAAAIGSGVAAAGAQPLVLKGSDGGDGLLDALADQISRRSTTTVANSAGQSIDIVIGWLDDTVAVVESRLICGVGSSGPPAAGPLTATTLGVGLALLNCADLGAKHVVVGLGGSATVDGGWGMAVANGWSFLSRDGGILIPGRHGMCDIAGCVPGKPFAGRITALCDVNVPFSGDSGAILFARQKGVPVDALDALQTCIDHFVRLSPEWESIAALGGAGAAGGLGFGLAAFAGAELKSGAHWVLQRIAFEENLAVADLVMTAEGKFDNTSFLGKLTGTVTARARERGVPVLVLAPGWDGVARDLAGLTVVTGEGEWSAADLEGHARGAALEAINLLGL